MGAVKKAKVVVVADEAPNQAAGRQDKRKQTRPNDKPVAESILVPDEYLKVQASLEAGSRVVFVTGNAGTGKSTLIRYLAGALDKSRESDMKEVAAARRSTILSGGKSVDL